MLASNTALLTSLQRVALGCTSRGTARGLGASALALTLLLGSGAARAESVWLVLGVDVGDPERDEGESARKLERSLRARGLEVIDGPSAAAQFERRHSRAVPPLSSEQIAALDGALHELADHLASENLEQSKRALAAFQELSPDVRDQLNQETQRARRRFHTCLLAAHLLSKEGERDQASEQIRRCALDFPGLEPEQSPYMPESLRSFFARAQQELRAIPAATLHVDVENGRDLRCSARVNGIDRGAVPVTVDEIRADRVRVQVDCGGSAGRVYALELEPGDNTLRVDPRLDRALRTAPSLGLSYPDEATAANNQLLHSLRIARAVGAARVLQLRAGVLHRIDVATRREQLAADPAATLERQLESLMADPSSSGQLQPMAAYAAAPDLPARESSGLRTLAWISAGAAVLAGGGVLVAWRVREGAVERHNDARASMPCTNRFDLEAPADCADQVATADEAERVSWAFGFAGLGLAGLAATLFAIDARDADEPASRARHRCSGGPGDLGVACTFRF